MGCRETAQSLPTNVRDRRPRWRTGTGLQAGVKGPEQNPGKKSDGECLGPLGRCDGQVPRAGSAALALPSVMWGGASAEKPGLAWRKLCSGHQRGGLLGPPGPALCLGAAPRLQCSPHLGSDEGASSAQGRAARTAAVSARGGQVACGCLCWLKAQHTACAVLRSQCCQGTCVRRRQALYLLQASWAAGRPPGEASAHLHSASLLRGASSSPPGW